MRIGLAQGKPRFLVRHIAGEGAVGVEDIGVGVQLKQQLLHARVLDDAALVDDGDVAAKLFGFLEIMRGEDDRGAGAVDFKQEIPHRAAQFDIDPGGGLVENQQPRLVHQRPGDHHAPLHAAGKRARALVALVPQAELFEVFLAARGGELARQAVVARLGSHHIADFLELAEVDLLGHDAEVELGLVDMGIDIAAENPHLARGFGDEGGEYADEGRFAGAVGPEQGEEIPLPDFEGNAFQRDGAAGVALFELADGDGNGHGKSAPHEGTAGKLGACAGFTQKTRLAPGFRNWRPLGVSNPCCRDENPVS